MALPDHRQRHIELIIELQNRLPCPKDHSGDANKEHSFRCYPEDLVKEVVANWRINGQPRR